MVAVLLCGCAQIGPNTVTRDRYDYSFSISESWKQQTLLNIVKLRYMDPPIFVDVGQIVAGYSLETGVSFGGSFPATDNFGGTTGTVGATGLYTDRPTVTYTPLTGNNFVRALMMPLPPDAVFFTMQSGYAADAMLNTAISVINGMRNQTVGLEGVTHAEPEFVRTTELMRKIQLSGAVGIRITEDAAKNRKTLVSFRSKDISKETTDDILELRQLLGLKPDTNAFSLVYEGVASSDTELAVLTRSLLTIMQMMAAHVDVPANHISEGRASPGFPPEPDSSGQRNIHILHSKDKPNDAYSSVFYQNYWYWVDNRDLKTKRAFAMLMLLFTLADTGDKDPMPLITIPAQ